MLPLTGKPEHQRFTIPSGLLTSVSSRQRSAISRRPLPHRARRTHLFPSQPHYGLYPAMFSGNDSLFLVANITREHVPVFSWQRVSKLRTRRITFQKHVKSVHHVEHRFF